MKIQYDLKNARTLTIWMSVGGILFALAIADEILHIAGNELFSLITLFLGGGLFLIFGYLSLSANLYIGMLKRYGYELPADKKDYDGKLANIPKDEAVYTKAIGDQERKSKTSTANSIMFALVFAGCMIWNILFFKKWEFMRGNATSVLVIMCVLDCIWLIMACMYFAQRNRAKYRDLVEIDETRKPRTTLARAIMNVCILLALTFGVKTTVSDMETYIFKACAASDQNLMCDLQNAVQTTYEERIGISMQVDKALEEGLVIDKSWAMDSVDQDTAAFFEPVLANFAMEDFGELIDRVHVADGTAEISIVLRDDTIVVELLNPLKEVNREIKSTGLDEERVEID